jgi:TolB-like protein
LHLLPQKFSDYIIDELAIAIGNNNKVMVIDRQYTDVIRKELNIQMSGDVSDDDVKRVGIQLGAQFVITGSLVDIGNAYRFRVIAINVETAVRVAANPVNINLNDPQVIFLLTGQRSTQTGPSVAPMSNNGGVYKIGDFGPAGGIVFYDKGVFSGGWRYLEAAPPETEFTAQWGGYEQIIDGTSTVAGSGKRNTQLIIAKLGQRGRAAQLCVSLDFDGYKDWFLPSYDELKLIYTNLKQKGLGGFSNSIYWSSSEMDKWVAYPLNFSDGLMPSTGGKNDTKRVRAVRAF